MIFDDKKITLKDGTTAILKTPEIEDAETLLDNIKLTNSQTDFFSRSPEDWAGFTADDEKIAENSIHFTI